MFELVTKCGANIKSLKASDIGDKWEKVEAQRKEQKNAVRGRNQRGK